MKRMEQKRRRKSLNQSETTVVCKSAALPWHVSSRSTAPSLPGAQMFLLCSCCCKCNKCAAAHESCKMTRSCCEQSFRWKCRCHLVCTGLLLDVWLQNLCAANKLVKHLVSQVSSISTCLQSWQEEEGPGFWNMHPVRAFGQVHGHRTGSTH